jgi:Polyketide cyclase / dehydrase and lipid transport
MTSIYREALIDANPDTVWAAVRDVGAVHKRLAPGFVVNVELEGDVRIVSFADGRVSREIIVGLDDTARRLAYAAVGVAERSHHNASMQVFSDGASQSRLVWITDVLPVEAATAMATNMERGLVFAKQTLEQERSAS